MKVDRKLNLIIDITRTDGSTLSIHATPIGAEVFDRFWEPISEAVSAIFKGEHGIVTGPRIAHKMLRKMAMKLGEWDGADGVQKALLPEIRRRAHLLMPGTSGYDLVPFDVARSKDLIDAQEADEIEGRLCFFTCCWEVILSEDQPQLLDRAASLWRVRLVSLNCTDYLNSLRMSMQGVNTGESQAAA